MAPEYVFQGQFSYKSDVFSFGILILEIVTGRKSSSFSYSDIYANLAGYVWEHWAAGEVNEIIEPSLGAEYQMTEVLRCVQIGLLCIQEVPANRPTMSSIVLMFDDVSMSLNVPSHLAFLPVASEVDRPPKDQHSLMELTITDMDPR
ncbi:unnamed protein product [Spirodela intermedia]|nr:unnamed protein product [Spirodela intermedia]